MGVTETSFQVPGEDGESPSQNSGYDIYALPLHSKDAHSPGCGLLTCPTVTLYPTLSHH